MSPMNERRLLIGLLAFVSLLLVVGASVGLTLLVTNGDDGETPSVPEPTVTVTAEPDDPFDSPRCERARDSYDQIINDERLKELVRKGSEKGSGSITDAENTFLERTTRRWTHVVTGQKECFDPGIVANAQTALDEMRRNGTY